MFKLSGMLFPFALGQYNSPENEFKFSVNNYDTLNAHANKCTIIAESSTSVVYCEDGYVAVDQSFEFIGSSGAYNKATSAMDLGGHGGYTSSNAGRRRGTCSIVLNALFGDLS